MDQGLRPCMDNVSKLIFLYQFMVWPPFAVHTFEIMMKISEGKDNPVFDSLVRKIMSCTLYSHATVKKSISNTTSLWVILPRVKSKST